MTKRVYPNRITHVSDGYLPLFAMGYILVLGWWGIFPSYWEVHYRVLIRHMEMAPSYPFS